jgi:hypothetical protein
MSFFSAIGHALKSRTVWAGIGTTALGISQVAAQYAPTILSFVPAGTPVGAGLTIGLGVATIIGRIMAKQPLGPVIDTTIAKSVDAVNALHESGDAVAAPTTLSQSKVQLATVKAIVKGPQ